MKNGQESREYKKKDRCKWVTKRQKEKGQNNHGCQDKRKQPIPIKTQPKKTPKPKESKQTNKKKQKKKPTKNNNNKNKNALHPMTLFLPVFWELRTSRKHMNRMIKLEENWLGFSVTLAVAGIKWKPKSYWQNKEGEIWQHSVMKTGKMEDIPVQKMSKDAVFLILEDKWLQRKIITLHFDCLLFFLRNNFSISMTSFLFSENCTYLWIQEFVFTLHLGIDAGLVNWWL